MCTYIQQAHNISSHLLVSFSYQLSRSTSPLMLQFTYVVAGVYIRLGLARTIHLYTVHIRYYSQEKSPNIKSYTHIRCVCMQFWPTLHTSKSEPVSYTMTIDVHMREGMFKSCHHHPSESVKYLAAHNNTAKPLACSRPVIIICLNL